MSDQTIREQFFKLKLGSGTNISWLPIPETQAEKAMIFIQEFRQKFPRVKVLPLEIKFNYNEHWESSENAKQDWANLKKLIVLGKETKSAYVVAQLKQRRDTPYFNLFEAASIWMKKYPKISWLEFITQEYAGKGCK